MQLLTPAPHRDNQVRRLKQCQVLGHCLPCHVEQSTQLSQRLPGIPVQLIEQLSTAFVSQSFEHSIHLASYYATKRIACHGRRKTAQKDATPAMIAETPTSGATIAGRGRSFSAAMTIATTIITSGFMIPRVS